MCNKLVCYSVTTVYTTISVISRWHSQIFVICMAIVFWLQYEQIKPRLLTKILQCVTERSYSTLTHIMGVLFCGRWS